jgi:L-rhamnose mutarotase
MQSLEINSIMVIPGQEIRLVEMQHRQAYQLSARDQVTKDYFKQQTRLFRDSLQQLDTQLAGNYTIGLAARRQQLAQQWSQTRQQQQQQFLALLEQQCSQALEHANTANSSIGTNALHEKLEQQVNTIYLETIALGKLKLRTSQLKALELVAASSKRSISNGWRSGTFCGF